VVIYWLFFFSLTQDKFDIVLVCALARVSFTLLTHHNLYPPNEIPGYAPARRAMHLEAAERLVKIYGGRKSPIAISVRNHAVSCMAAK